MTDRTVDQESDQESELDSIAADDDRWDNFEEIGTGGVGTVFRGRQVRLDRDVAIKEIRNIFDVFADIQREDIVRRFQRIVQDQARLSHPNVVQVYDVETDVEYPYVVTEYAPNGNLRRLIDSDERTLRVALKYFIQLLHGLNAAHDAGMVHGNIKPENVVLDESGNAKLSDFGLSTLVDLGGASNQVYVGVGAVAYMSPEQFQDPNAATIKSDIYTLGIMFYEMLTGKVPGRRSPMPSSFFPDIPRKIDDIFDQMSMDDPEDRYSSVDAILKDFYGADEIAELLDKHSGVVFFRDPVAHGDALFGDREATAGSSGEALGGATLDDSPDPVDDTPDEPDVEFDADVPPEADAELEAPVEDDFDDLDAESAEASDEESGAESDADEQSDDAHRQAADEADADPEEADDEVLDKLDQYGAMFEDE